MESYQKLVWGVFVFIFFFGKGRGCSWEGDGIWKDFYENS